jgi:hypothetical protein
MDICSNSQATVITQKVITQKALIHCPRTHLHSYCRHDCYLSNHNVLNIRKKNNDGCNNYNKEKKKKKKSKIEQKCLI